MNILHYCAEEPGPMADWQLHHIAAELRTSGHAVTFLNPVEQLGLDASAADYSQFTLDEVRRLHAGNGFDLFYATATEATLLPSAVDEIKRLGIATVNMAPDAMSHPYRVRSLCPKFDLTWTLVRESVPILEGYGARLIVMPLAANPHLFKPCHAAEERVVGFIGSCYGARARALAHIAANGLPAVVYGRAPSQVYSDGPINNPLARALLNVGDSWRRLFESLRFDYGRACIAGALKRSALEVLTKLPEKDPRLDDVPRRQGPSFEDMGACVSALALTLGSMDLASTYVLRNPLYVIRLREFEMAMCGGVHLVNRFAELQEYFEEDQEMLYYGSIDEMIDKVAYYLDPQRDRVRTEIRQRARARAESDHTWSSRFKEIGRTLGFAL